MIVNENHKETLVGGFIAEFSKSKNRRQTITSVPSGPVFLQKKRAVSIVFLRQPPSETRSMYYSGCAFTFVKNPISLRVL